MTDRADAHLYVEHGRLLAAADGAAEAARRIRNHAKDLRDGSTTAITGHDNFGWVDMHKRLLAGHCNDHLDIADCSDGHSGNLRENHRTYKRTEEHNSEQIAAVTQSLPSKEV